MQFNRYLTNKAIIIGDSSMKMRIWQERNLKKITIQELSKRTKISIGALSNYENGKRSPNMIQLELIAEALDTKIENLYESQFK